MKKITRENLTIYIETIPKKKTPGISNDFIIDGVTDYCKVKGIAIDKVVVARKPTGKPYVEKLPLYISLTHTGITYVLVVSPNPIGVDAEHMKPKNFKPIVDKFFSAIADKIDTEETFYKEWCKREAYKKLTDIPFADAIRNRIRAKFVFCKVEDVLICLAEYQD